MRSFTAASIFFLAIFVLTATVQAQIIIDDGSATTPNTTDIIWTGSWNYRPETGTSNKPGSWNDTGSRFAYYDDAANN